MTRYQLHVQKWQGGCGSDLCPGKGRASNVVLCRGKLPCDVLFVGEAPGTIEDHVGSPFIGPAGKLLDQIIEEAIGHRPELRLAFTNLVGCIPLEEDGTKAKDGPPFDAIECCSERLSEFARIADPKLIVMVGKHAKDFLTTGYTRSIDVGEAPRVDITHPSRMLRTPNEAQRVLFYDRAVVVIRAAVEEHIPGR